MMIGNVLLEFQCNCIKQGPFDDSISSFGNSSATQLLPVNDEGLWFIIYHAKTGFSSNFLISNFGIWQSCFTTMPINGKPTIE